MAENTQTDGYRFNGEAGQGRLTARSPESRGLITRALAYLGLERKAAPEYGKGFSTSTFSDAWRFNGWGWNRWRGGIHYTAEVGALEESSLVMAVVNWTSTQLPEAVPVVHKPAGKDNALEPEWGHPAAELIQNPNPFSTWAEECGPLALSWWIDGNSYHKKEYDSAGDLQELWYLPHFLVEERWPSDGRSPEVPTSGPNKADNNFLSHYEFRVPGKAPVLYNRKEVLHIKRGKDPNNPRKGIGAFGPVIREIYGDNAAATFSATILRNMGWARYVVSPKEKDLTIEDTAAMAMKERFIAATSGANAGSVLINTVPVDIQELGLNPAKLDLSALRSVPESRVAAVTGIPAAMLQFMVGLENGTSFAAYREARQQGYESVIIPIQSAIAAQLTNQLLPDFKDTKGARLMFDVSQVRVLQEDRDALYRRATSALQAGGISRNQFLASLGKPPVDKEEIYYVPAMANVMTQERIEATAAEEPETPPVDLTPEDATMLATMGNLDNWMRKLDEGMKNFTP